MADKKKDSHSSPSYTSFEIIFLIIFIWGGVSIAINWASRYHDKWASFLNNLPYYLINIFAKYAVFALFLSIALFILVIIYAIKEKIIKEKIINKILPLNGIIKTDSKDSIIENPKWKLVEEHINSDDANKWKLAILEADIILNELLGTLNLLGESIGEKLKNVEESDFDHIEEAWEAHKIRNAIAHQGSDFLITQREAKRVIRLYELVFKEFEVI